MKNTLLITLLFALTFGACKKDRPKIGDVQSKVDGIAATWTIKNVMVKDMRDPLQTSLDITPFYKKSNPMRITFTISKTYSVQAGDGKNVFGTSGTWAFDDDQFPTEIRLTSNGNTIVMPLVNTIRPSDKLLKLDYSNIDCGERVISKYLFTFERI
jgi:hypothetical protein